MNHTPGPWGRNIKPASRYPIIYAGRNTHVARILTEGLTDEEAEANCDLVAAAPDLLEALIRALNVLELEYPEGMPVIDAARAAIQRAQPKTEVETP